MKILDGNELVGYIEERQIKQVRALRQSWRVIPRLAIICDIQDNKAHKYVNMKKDYGQDILVEVDVYNLPVDEIKQKVTELNSDENTLGIIVQLPLTDESKTLEIIDAIAPEKDVDGLKIDSPFPSTAVMAIDWMIAGYNVEMSYKKIGIVGESNLVSVPLCEAWTKAGWDVFSYAEIDNLAGELPSCNIIISVSGQKDLIKSNMLKSKATVIDASVATENPTIEGCLADDLQYRKDIKVAPVKGGIGPLITASLFDNVINAARKIADIKGQQDNK